MKHIKKISAYFIHQQRLIDMLQTSPQSHPHLTFWASYEHYVESSRQRVDSHTGSDLGPPSFNFVKYLGI